MTGKKLTDKEFGEKKREGLKDKTIEERQYISKPNKKKANLSSLEPIKFKIGKKEFEIKHDEKIDIKKIISFIDEIESHSDIDEVIKRTLEFNPACKDSAKHFICERVIDLGNPDFIYKSGTFDESWNRIKKERKEKTKKTTAKKEKALTKPIVDRLAKEIKDITIKYDDNSIELTNKGIWFVKPMWIGGILEFIPSEILNGKLEILYKVYDEKNEKLLFTYKFKNRFYHTQTRKEMIYNLSYDTYKGLFGIDIIKKVINYYDETLDLRIAKPVLGFDNGWVLPILNLEKEKNYAIISTNHYQSSAYKNAKNMYKKYSLEDKIKIKKIMNGLIKLTQMKPVNQSIIIGWAMAAPFRKAFIYLIKIFPQLNLIGERESGKSAFFDLFTTQFYKIYDSAFTSSDFISTSRITSIMTGSTFPAHFEEIKEVSKYTLSILKELATNDFYRDRMSKDGVHITQSSLMSAPFGTDANYFVKEFIDLAYNTRSINLFFDESDIIIRDPEWLKIERMLKKIKLFSLLYDITKDWTNKDILNQLESIEEEYKDDIKKLDEYYPRLSRIFGIKLFEKAFDITLEKDNIIKELTSSRQNLTKPILQLFFHFCQRARDYEEEIIISKTIEEKTVKLTRMKDKRYINHRLNLNSKRDYDFTKENLGDFNILLKIHGEKIRALSDLAGELREALSPKDKQLIQYTITTRSKKPIALILTKNDFLPRESSSDYEEDEEIGLDIDKIIDEIDGL